jgi:hypothetical protein
MARKPVVKNTPVTAQPSSVGTNNPLGKTKIKVKGITPIESHYMNQINFAFSYISGSSEKNIAVVVLDSYLDDDSLLSFSGKYFQSLFKPGASKYFGDYFEYNGNKIQFASVVNAPKLTDYLFFTVGDSVEYTSELENWVTTGKYINQYHKDDSILLN